MRLCAMTAGFGVALGCSSSSVFVCDGNADCLRGRCEPTGYCSFQTSNCASGWVYGEFAASSLAGTCVGQDTATGGIQTVGPTASPDTSTSDDPTTDVSDPTMGVTSDSPGSTSYADTGYDDDTGGYIPYFCQAYADVLVMCYGEQAGQAQLMYCPDAYEDYYDTSYDCGSAYQEFLACLSSLDCRQLESSSLYCDGEQAFFLDQCNLD